MANRMKSAGAHSLLSMPWKSNPENQRVLQKVVASKILLLPRCRIGNQADGTKKIIIECIAGSDTLKRRLELPGTFHRVGRFVCVPRGMLSSPKCCPVVSGAFSDVI